MAIKKSHCSPVSRGPEMAQTIAELKFDTLADWLTNLELMRRSAPWGVVFGKGGSSGS